MKTRWRTVGLIAVTMLLVPQLFVLAYYFPLLIPGPRRWGVLAGNRGFGLEHPFVGRRSFFVVAADSTGVDPVACALWVVFLSMLVAGFGGVALWNTLIYDLFGYLRSILPLLLCCTVTVGYMLAMRVYKAGLPVPKNKEDGES